MILGRSKNSKWLTDNCYIIFSVLAFLTFYYDTPDIIRQLVFLLVAVLNIKLIRIGRLNSVVIFLFAAACLSLTGSVIRPYPISFFLTDMYWAYLPIIFYFIGSKTFDTYPAFYQRSLWAFMFVFLIGYFFLLFPTEKYISKTLELLNIHSEYNEGTYMYARFASFLDSYHTSNLGVCSLCFSFGLLKFQNKNRTLVKLVAIVAIAISFITIMLAQQRVAMNMSVPLMIYYLISNSKNNKMGGIITLLVLGILLIFAINYYINFMGEGAGELVTGRFTKEGSSTLLTDRSTQWSAAINGFLMEPLFGLGIGSGGHLAVEAGLKPVVADGSYFKILLEGGIASFIPFIIILLSSLIKGYKNRKIYYVEFPLLLFFSFSLLGANIIDMPYIIMFMWYIIGRINRNKNTDTVYG